MFAAIATALMIQTPPAPDLSWMAGYWLDCTDGREASETWSDPRGGLLVGHAVTVSARGRVSFEVSHIRPTADGLAYVAQPGGAPPTAFVLIDSGPTRATFQNLENDFPHRIIYARQGDRMTARIEGVMDGQAAAMDWTFDRAELNSRCPR